jgi:hypothetical protein
MENATFIGISPARVEWYDYTGNVERQARMREVLKQHWDRSKIKVTGLTGAQVDLIEDALALFCEAERMEMGWVTSTKTTMEIPRVMLEAVLERLEWDLDSEDVFFDLEGEATQAQYEFALQAKLRSLRSTVKKLRAVLD